jgi:hypothetical protein
MVRLGKRVSTGKIGVGTPRVALAATALLALAGGTVIAQTAPPPAAAAPVEPTFTRVTLDKDFAKTFQLYDKVDKADRKIVRFLYIDKPSLAKVKPGEPLPDGVTLVMEDHAIALESGGAPLKSAEGRLVPTGRIRAVAVMSKTTGWGETNLFPPDKDNGDWEYASFKPDGSPNPIKLDNCYACHLANVPKDQDFTFSIKKIHEAAKR